MKSPLIIVIGILCFVAFTTAAFDNITSKFTRVVCIVHDKVLIRNISCSARPVSRSRTVVNLRGYLTRQLNNAVVHLQLYKNYNVYKPFLVNVKENYCHFYSKHASAPYLKIISNIVGRSSNLIHECPFSEGEAYIKDLEMDKSKLVVPWPEGDYRMNIAVADSETSKPFLTVLVYIEVGRNWQKNIRTITPNATANGREE